MEASPAGSSVCPIDFCAISDQQFHNFLVSTVNRCRETVAGRYVNLEELDSITHDYVHWYTCI